MAFKRDRQEEDVRRELTDIMHSLKDPRIQGLLSIVKCDLSGDGSSCKVYVSSLEGLENAQRAAKGLNNAAGFIRREIGLRMDMRHTPEFHFIADDSIEYGARISGEISRLKEQNKL